MPKKAPSKPKTFSLTREEQLYVHDHSKHISLHNYLIQNYILYTVLNRLEFDINTVDVNLTADLTGVIIKPRATVATPQEVKGE